MQEALGNAAREETSRGKERHEQAAHGRALLGARHTRRVGPVHVALKRLFLLLSYTIDKTQRSVSMNESGSGERTIRSHTGTAGWCTSNDVSENAAR